MSLNLDVIKNGEECEVKLIGRMDAVTSPDAQQALLELAVEYDSIVLDLGGLAYISSAGLRALKALRVATRKKGGRLALKEVTSSVMEVFEVTGFASLFTFV